MSMEILMLLVTAISYSDVPGWCAINIMHASEHKFHVLCKMPNMLKK
jgi:hypothetical protein